MMPESQQYREELPDDCPPADAYAPLNGLRVFRLVASFPPGEDDFRSYRSLNPASVVGVPECQTRGRSVYTNADDAEKRRKLPKLKNLMTCAVSLNPSSGKLKQTGQPSHHTWWPSAHFRVLENCERIDT